MRFFPTGRIQTLLLALAMLLAPLEGVFAKSKRTEAKPAARQVVKKAKKRPAVEARKRSTPRRAVAGKRPSAGKRAVARSRAKAPVAKKGRSARIRAAVVRRPRAPEPLRLVDGKPILKSSVAYVIDQETGEVLLGKNDDDVRPIASLTKLMTGIIVADARLPMDETITITADDVDRLKGSSSRLKVGTELTRREALHLSLMSSENRAAHALARTYPGGESAFIAAMNNMARQIGMDQTHYVEPTGLSSRNQSSARDLALLAAAAFERPLLRKYSTSSGYRLGALRYVNTNRLVRDDGWGIGVQKTGYISEAGQCLVLQARLEGRKLIMVFLDSATKYTRIKDAETVRRWLRTNPAGEGDGDGAQASGRADPPG